MQRRKVLLLGLMLVGGMGLFLSFGCQKEDPTVNAAPSPAANAKAPAPVQRNWKRIGPIGKGGGDI